LEASRAAAVVSCQLGVTRGKLVAEKAEKEKDLSFFQTEKKEEKKRKGGHDLRPPTRKCSETRGLLAGG